MEFTHGLLGIVLEVMLELFCTCSNAVSSSVNSFVKGVLVETSKPVRRVRNQCAVQKRVATNCHQLFSRSFCQNILKQGTGTNSDPGKFAHGIISHL
jgi:hypothetical protein